MLECVADVEPEQRDTRPLRRHERYDLCRIRVGQTRIRAVAVANESLSFAMRASRPSLSFSMRV
jgi:hypothetical protein